MRITGGRRAQPDRVDPVPRYSTTEVRKRAAAMLKTVTHRANVDDSSNFTTWFSLNIITTRMEPIPHLHERTSIQVLVSRGLPQSCRRSRQTLRRISSNPLLLRQRRLQPS